MFSLRFMFALVPLFISFSLNLLAEENRPQQAGEQFFEKKIRPLFHQHCISCHGAKKQEASLRLDRRSDAFKGGDNGKVFVPGHPGESRLLEVLKHDENDLQMPPKEKLSEEKIRTIANWIQQGAPWPVDLEAESEQKIRPEDHWAFQPFQKVRIPSVGNQNWVKNPIDAFILSRLEQKNLTPSEPAKPYELIRRIKMDLVGLPLRYEEVQSFLKDTSSGKVASLVDRYLSSRQYGERWARHWLDVARYADSKGYVFQEDVRYPYSYTYRNYVIDAFHSDVPFDQFIKEQLAADYLKKAENDPSLAGLGFLTVGRRFRNSSHDIYDDRIDVMMRGFMGLSVTCARCHDHKYDPVSMEDYYALYGVFASSQEPKNLPVIGTIPDTPESRRYQSELAKRQQQVNAYVTQQTNVMSAKMRSLAKDYLLQIAWETKTNPKDPKPKWNVKEVKTPLRLRWQRALRDQVSPEHPIAGPFRIGLALGNESFSEQLQQRLKTPKAKASVNPVVLQWLQERKPQTRYELASVYADLFQSIEQKAKQFQKEKKPLPKAEEDIRKLFYEQTKIEHEEFVRIFDRAQRNKYRELEKKVAQWKVESPDAPPRAMILQDSKNLYNPYVFQRGNPGRRGETVPRRFLTHFGNEKELPFQIGSGRLELAEAIINHPLTARVIVNRVWMHHFNEGLVRTPDDFGLRGNVPTHPELLDWLAQELIRNHWSVKFLHRLILQSNTYQQSSRQRDVGIERDPENLLLWRMNLRRVEFEAMRDSLLYVSGQLELKPFGKPVRWNTPQANNRRTLYLFVDRNNLPGLYRAFDFANPDASTGQRPRTTVPQQALFGMNAPFVIEQSRRLVQHAKLDQHDTSAEKIRQLYRMVLARDPNETELSVALAYVKSQQDAKLNRYQKLAHVLLMSNELHFID